MSDAPDSTPSFFARLILAWIAYFRVIFDPRFAASVQALADGKALPAPAAEKPTAAPAPEKPAAVPEKKDPGTAALQLLSLFQREGRFVDFLEQDIASFPDADVGAAARVVHEGCRKALKRHVEIEPIRSEEEGSKIVLEAGFDATSVKLVGDVKGSAPFKGTLQHKGWRAKNITLAEVTAEHDAKVLAPAEVEL